MKPLAIALLMLALAAPAAAQTDPQLSPAQQAAKCRMQSDQDGGKQPGGGNLTDKLSDCGGVLEPPPTGDQGIAAPAPNEGKTPVIKPGEVPAQPPAQ